MQNFYPPWYKWARIGLISLSIIGSFSLLFFAFSWLIPAGSDSGATALLVIRIIFLIIGIISLVLLGVCSSLVRKWKIVNSSERYLSFLENQYHTENLQNMYVEHPMIGQRFNQFMDNSTYVYDMQPNLENVNYIPTNMQEDQ